MELYKTFQHNYNYSDSFFPLTKVRQGNTNEDATTRTIWRYRHNKDDLTKYKVHTRLPGEVADMIVAPVQAGVLRKVVKFSKYE